MADQAAVGRPVGTVTMLFTDIEGSTRLLHELGVDAYSELLGLHHRIVRTAVGSSNGVEIKTEGDSFFVVFASASDALCAAAEAQRSLAKQKWPNDARVRVRMGVHTGDVQLSEGEYVGMDVHRAARVSAAAHGGQILLSEATRSVAESTLPDGLSIHDLGEHLLKDIDQPELLFQLVVEGLTTDFPEPRAMSTRFDLLPADMSSFIGRDEELQRARDLLRSTRLLTLTGPGGTGKTRLSIELARSVAGEYEDGVAFVPLASITDPELVPSTIRQALGIGEQLGTAATETLIERLKDREVLIVLDNFEQVVAAASVVSALLEAIPGLTFIVSSRVALKITGEQEYVVPPLSVPAAADTSDLDSLSRSDAVALFMQRARAVRSDFELTHDNARAVAEICARLDGLPLAIELAASRIKLLSPAAILERLSDRLNFLQSTAADRTDRQRTLRGAIDWSYSLLAEPERALFRRLSIFVGGWRLDEADDVASAAGILQEDLLDGMASLVDHSLVRRVDEDEDVRFGMFETIREYGLEQLEAAGEKDVTELRHAECYAELAATAEPSLTLGPEWPERLEAEHANIRAAIRWLMHHDIEKALLMCGQLWRFWHLRGHLREGSSIITAALEHPTAAAHTFARAKALIGLGGIVYWRTQYELARRYYEEALAIAREISDERLAVETLYSLAYVRAIEGDLDGAIRDLDEARSLYEQQSNQLGATWAAATIGMCETLRGRHEESLPILVDAIARFERLGDAFGIRNAKSVMDRALMHLNRLDDARAQTRDALSLADAAHDLTSLSAVMLDVAALDALEGNYERAAILIGAAERIVDESGGQAPPQLVNRIDALPTLREHLPAERLAQLMADGQTLTEEAALELALAR
jgi:predicted ATPase/class 3 adenylate cyclase